MASGSLPATQGPKAATPKPTRSGLCVRHHIHAYVYWMYGARNIFLYKLIDTRWISSSLPPITCPTTYYRLGQPGYPGHYFKSASTEKWTLGHWTGKPVTSCVCRQDRAAVQRPRTSISEVSIRTLVLKDSYEGIHIKQLATRIHTHKVIGSWCY